MERKEHIREHIVDCFLEGGTQDPALDNWLDEDESNRKDFEYYKKIWKETGRYLRPEDLNTDFAWNRVNTVNRKKESKRVLLKNICYVASGVAASLLVMFALSFMGIWDKQPDMRVSMVADYGSRSEIVLPDGSTVRLNAGSDVTYFYNSKEKIREVNFQGEGFFDVSKSNTPFIVTLANGLKVKVWGTSFNLKAYAEDETVQASLVEGCIELNHNKDKLVMKPGEIAVYNKQTDKIERVPGVLSHSFGWLDNKLYMDNMSLSEVCTYLSRWYDVDITIEKELGDSIHYNGVLQEETITEVMDALSRLSQIQYHVKGKNISITPK